MPINQNNYSLDKTVQQALWAKWRVVRSGSKKFFIFSVPKACPSLPRNQFIPN